MKICINCNESKPVTEFHADKGKRDGRSSRCKVCARAISAQWRAENPGRNREYIAQWAIENREKMREYKRAYSEKNKERESRRLATYRKFLKSISEGKHTADDIKRQFDAQHGKCYYCGCEVGDRYHADHAIPLSRGGSDGPENIVIACPPCNQSKGNKLPHEWIQGGRLL